MKRDFHPGTFTAGAIFVVFGIAFTLEGLEVWTLELRNLDVLFPLAILAIGVAVLFASLWAKPRRNI